jgi:3-methyladenine DNA glycosylase AlkD
MLALEPAADAARAASMAAYMHGRFPFLGIQAPERGTLLRSAWADLPEPSTPDLGAAVTHLWRLRGREYQYAASDLLGRCLRTTARAARVDPGFLTDVVRPLLVTTPWWDTVDALRGSAVGPLVAAHPDLASEMRAWVLDDDRWLVRSAIIHQLGFGDRTDEALLLDLCARRATDREPFVAKAIGWALRTHARRHPDVVRRFCAEHPELTPLARREALKHLSG